jgi:hypothetical protein
MPYGPKPSGRTKTIGAIVTPDDHARFTAEARRRGVTVSALLYEIIAPALAKMQPAAPPSAAPRHSAAPRTAARRVVFDAEEARDITGIVMGDPPPERSALGRRAGR